MVGRRCRAAQIFLGVFTSEFHAPGRSTANPPPAPPIPVSQDSHGHTATSARNFRRPANDGETRPLETRRPAPTPLQISHEPVVMAGKEGERIFGATGFSARFGATRRMGGAAAPPYRHNLSRAPCCRHLPATHGNFGNEGTIPLRYLCFLLFFCTFPLTGGAYMLTLRA